MPTFICAFFSNIAPGLPIVAFESVTSSYLLSSLSPPLANVIAALAAPYVFSQVILPVMSDFTRYVGPTPQFAHVDLLEVAQAYTRQAEVRFRARKVWTSLTTRMLYRSRWKM
jgi:hypothetical protein